MSHFDRCDILQVSKSTLMSEWYSVTESPLNDVLQHPVQVTDDYLQGG